MKIRPVYPRVQAYKHDYEQGHLFFLMKKRRLLRQAGVQGPSVRPGAAPARPGPGPAAATATDPGPRRTRTNGPARDPGVTIQVRGPGCGGRGGPGARTQSKALLGSQAVTRLGSALRCH